MKRNISSLVLLCVSFFAPPSASAVTIQWSPVGSAGNLNDTADGDSILPGIQNFGAVSYSYNIGTYDVTNTQYVEFLNTKDPTGGSPLALYNSQMSDPTYGGIAYNPGAANGSKYSVMSGDGNHPVTFVTWYDAVRFTNWLNNGQGNGGTESGAYTLEGGTPTPSNANSITREAGATVFLPSETEWYKAAYYDPNTSTYNLYPTSSSLIPNASGPTATPNSVNYNNAVGNLTDVGVYSGTTSPYGAFDMAGNAWQWNEDRFGSARTLRGGSFSDNSVTLASSLRNITGPSEPNVLIGFRLASVPEPSSLVLAAFGLLGLAAWGWRRTRARMT